jgi:hypothetical protein
MTAAPYWGGRTIKKGVTNMLNKLKLNIFLASVILTTIMDKFNEFSESQAFTTGANTSTKSFDTKGADIGTGEDLYLTIHNDVTCTSGGGATVAFAYVESAAADLSAPTVLYTTAAIGYATLVAGYQAVKIKIPANTKRYVGVIYTVAGADLTAGKFSAFLSKDLQSAKTRIFPSGYVNN